MPRPTFLLKSAAALALVLGLGLIVWLTDKAIRYPEIQARQFGRFGEAAPLWLPLIGFVGFFLISVVVIFWRAARRVEAGEDLFARRHRRRPGGAKKNYNDGQ